MNGMQDVLSSSRWVSRLSFGVVEEHDFSFVFEHLAHSFVESVGNSIAPLERLGSPEIQSAFTRPEIPRFGALSQEASISAIDKSTYYCISPERIFPKH
jgi:hypothetical protein